MNCIAKQRALAAYWVNTSSSPTALEELKTDVEELLRRGIVEKTLEEGVIFTELQDNPDVIWSLLLLSGYLSLAATWNFSTPCRLCIPNEEIKELYHSIILKWFKQTIQESKYNLLLKSLITGDIGTFSQIFEKFLLSAFSFFNVTADEPEKIYHSFVLGVLIGLKDRYDLKSNRESGYGRYDVILIPKDPQDLGIVLEFKKLSPSKKTDLESAADTALQQIEERKYDLKLKERNISRILHLSLAFQGKSMAMRSKSL